MANFIQVSIIFYLFGVGVVVVIRFVVANNTKIVNNIKKSGVISKNIKQTRIANKTLLGISDILTDPLQYYTDTDFIKPTDINGLDS